MRSTFWGATGEEQLVEIRRQENRLTWLLQTSESPSLNEICSNVRVPLQHQAFVMSISFLHDQTNRFGQRKPEAKRPADGQ